ncbi:16496_t:CDS:1 [Entrophospora sp. SA101]|nr:16496_t:CDS:1 [Entrophospora sp. SA101]CAJ0911469.1 8612_t:CDS:1 [Entrophospora sp. SA101]
MVKRMRSDAVPLSPEDYKFIIQYRDAKLKTEVLKELRKKYPMTNDRFYRIWRGQEVSMIEWYQPISDLTIPPDRNLSIPESRLPNIDQASITENSIVTSDKRVKNRKSRSKSVQISDLPDNVTAGSFRDESTIHKPTKKVGEEDDLYTLIERNRKETEEAERESEKILAIK